VTRAALALCVLAAVVRAAAADPATADRLAAEANTLAAAGKLAAAASKFREAWLADKLRPELFCNIGISYYKAKDLVRAHLWLGQCLEQAALEPKTVAAVRGVVASVEDVLRAGGYAPVRIVVEPSATGVTIPELGPDEAFVGTRVVWLALGAYHVAGHAESYVDATQPVTVESAAPITVSLALHKPAAPDVPPVQPAVHAAHASRWPAVLVTAGAAAAAGVAAYAYVAGHARADLAASALDRQILADDRDAVSRWNTTLVVAGSVAGAGAAVGGYLWYRAFHTEPALEIHAGPGGGGVSLSGRF